MAVELDVELRNLTTVSGLKAQTLESLISLLNLTSAPTLEIIFLNGTTLERDFVISQSPCSFWMRIGECAKVDVLVYRDPLHQDCLSARLSYAPLRTNESRALWLASAVALARLNATPILDDGLLLGSGPVADADRIEQIFRVPGPAGLFEEQAARIRLVGTK